MDARLIKLEELIEFNAAYKVKELEITGCKDEKQNECESQGFYYAGESSEFTITTNGFPNVFNSRMVCSSADK